MTTIARFLALIPLLLLPACAARSGEDPNKFIGADVSVAVRADVAQGKIAILGKVASVTDKDLVLIVVGKPALGSLRDNIKFLEKQGKVSTKAGPPLEVTVPRDNIREIVRVDVSSWPPKLIDPATN